jgi:hypothetical protein
MATPPHNHSIRLTACYSPSGRGSSDFDEAIRPGMVDAADGVSPREVESCVELSFSPGEAARSVNVVPLVKRTALLSKLTVCLAKKLAGPFDERVALADEPDE